MGAPRGRTRRPWIGLGLLALFAALGAWLLRDGGAGSAPVLTAPSAVAPAEAAPQPRASADGAERTPAPSVAEPEQRSRGRSGPAEGSPRATDRPLRGRAIDEAGAPLEGVRVTFTGARWSGNAEEVLRRNATSASDGGFVIEDFPRDLAGESPSVEKEGYVLLRADPVRPAGDGAWSPVTLVLARAATLEVTLADVDGAPLAGVRLAALAVPEHLGAAAARTGALAEAARDRWRWTEDDGRVRFEVPAARRLAVVCELEGAQLVYERVEGERLSTDLRGEPLVLEPGELRRVGLFAGITLRLEGIVLDPARRAVPRARVRVLAGEPEDNAWLESLRDLRADDEGRFELSLRGLAPEDALTLIAADGEFIAIRGGGARAATRRRIVVAEQLARPGPLELVLEELLTISGRVEDEAGAPVSSVVWAVPPGAEYVLQKGELGFLPIAGFTSDGGAFEIPALRPGLHDVIVKRNTPRTYHRFPGIEAGAEGLVLTIGDDRVVHMRLVVENAREGDRLRPLVLWHQPRDPRSFGRPAPAAYIGVETCDEARWPAGSLGRLSLPGRSTDNVEHAAGRTIVMIEEPGDAGDRELEPRQVGCYSVGLLGRDAEDRPYARRLSEPLWLGAGETTFVVRLELAATLEGSAPIAEGEDLRLELRDARGERVHGAGGERWSAVSPDGSFRVEELPPGWLELRVGTPEELAAGRWRLRDTVELAPGGTARLDL